MGAPLFKKDERSAPSATICEGGVRVVGPGPPGTSGGSGNTTSVNTTRWAYPRQGLRAPDKVLPKSSTPLALRKNRPSNLRKHSPLLPLISPQCHAVQNQARPKAEPIARFTGSDDRPIDVELGNVASLERDSDSRGGFISVVVA